MRWSLTQLSWLSLIEMGARVGLDQVQSLPTCRPGMLLCSSCTSCDLSTSNSLPLSLMLGRTCLCSLIQGRSLIKVNAGFTTLSFPWVGRQWKVARSGKRGRVQFLSCDVYDWCVSFLPQSVCRIADRLDCTSIPDCASHGDKSTYDSFARVVYFAA